MNGDSPAARYRQFIIGLLVGTVGTGIQLAALTAVALFGAVGHSRRAGMYAILAVGAYSLYIATTDVFETASDSDFEPGWLATQALSVLSVVYFNLLVAVAVGLALAVGPQFGVAVAVLYPIADARIVELGIPLSISGLAVIGMAAIIGLSSLSESVSWRDLRPLRPSVLGTIRRRPQR